MNYRKLAFEKYGHDCTYCGCGIEDIIEIAHINGNNKNPTMDNLVPLCPTCHRMLDIDIISGKIIKLMRDRRKQVKWEKLYKNAHKKAAITRNLNKSKIK